MPLRTPWFSTLLRSTALKSDLLWVAGGRLVAALATLVAIRVATTLLEPSEYGLFTVLATFQMFCGLFLINPVGQYINRHTHEWGDDGSLYARLVRFRSYVLVAAAAGALAVGIWAALAPTPSPRLIAYMLVVFGMVVAATWNATYVVLLNMFGHRASSVLWGTGTVVLGLAFSSLLVVVFGGGLSWFAGQATGMALGALGARHVLLKTRPKLALAPVKPLLEAGALRQYILPLAVATGFMWCLVSGYRLVIDLHWGLAALGALAVGFTLATQLWGLAESLGMQYLFPLYYRRIAHAGKEEGAQAFSDLLNTLGPVYVVLAAAMLPSAAALLKVFVSAQYANVVLFLQWGALFEFCRVAGNLLGSAAQVERRMTGLILPYLAGALVLAVGLLALGQRSAPIEHAAALVAASGAVMLLVMGVLMRWRLPYRFDLARWGFACAVLACSVAGVYWSGFAVNNWEQAAWHVAVVGVAAMVCIAALLWKNPAVKELMAVRLS